MKKFSEAGEHYFLTALDLDRVRVQTQGPEPQTARILCEDACRLSSDGTGETALEFLRIASPQRGGRIRHLLILRGHDRSEKSCMLRQEALLRGVLGTLNRAGYDAAEISFEEFTRLRRTMDTSAVWALGKKAVQSPGIYGAHGFVPVVEAVDWQSVYAVLDGSGCSLSVQVIPSLLSPQDRNLICENLTRCVRAAEGFSPAVKDSLAAAPGKSWQYYADRMDLPMAEVHLLVSGPPAAAALAAARLQQAVSPAALRVSPMPQTLPVYSQPWKMAGLANGKTAAFTKWSMEEAGQILRLPVQGDFFLGIRSNPFSLIPESEFLPEAMTAGRGIRLGTAVFSGQTVCLPKEAFLVHTAVFGKSGVGKTTMLKQLIRQLRAQGIPVLILEPVKREYRELLAEAEDTRIFTVEAPAVPLRINPFLVPEGVRLREYKGCLLSAFKAAFSLPDPLPALFEKAISRAYTQYGWTDSSRTGDPEVTVFDMADFLRVFQRILAQSSYSGEVKGNLVSGGSFRLQSLLERCPQTFDTLPATRVCDLLEGTTVLEMGTLEPEQKSLVCAITLIRILAWLKATRSSGQPLRNVILIDEAHALLDQGEGATVEEKSLNSAMTQMMINLITEIRAYGVGVVLSDQSPSRIGSRMLDNVENILSFRLSGEEARMLAGHIGAEDTVKSALPLLETGEFLLANHLLRAPLGIRMDSPPVSRGTVTDEQVAAAQEAYLASRREDNRPYAQCAAVSCGACSPAVREEARKLAGQIFLARRGQLTTPEALAQHLRKLPQVLGQRLDSREPGQVERLCRCVGVHLARLTGEENGIAIHPDALKILMEDGT